VAFLMPPGGAAGPAGCGFSIAALLITTEVVIDDKELRAAFPRWNGRNGHAGMGGMVRVM